MSGTGTGTGRMITMFSCERRTVNVREVVARQSPTISKMIEEAGNGDIWIQIANAKVLTKVFEYCEKHLELAGKDEELKAFDEEFVKVDDEDFLFDLILAADYLEIENLEILTSRTLYDLNKGRTVEEIRKTFNRKNVFTSEQVEMVFKQNGWALP